MSDSDFERVWNAALAGNAARLEIEARATFAAIIQEAAARSEAAGQPFSPQLEAAIACVQETATLQPWFTQTIRTAGPRWRDQNHPPECSCFFCHELTTVL